MRLMSSLCMPFVEIDEEDEGKETQTYLGIIQQIHRLFDRGRQQQHTNR